MGSTSTLLIDVESNRMVYKKKTSSMVVLLRKIRRQTGIDRDLSVVIV